MGGASGDPAVIVVFAGTDGAGLAVAAPGSGKTDGNSGAKGVPGLIVPFAGMEGAGLAAGVFWHAIAAINNIPNTIEIADPTLMFISFASDDDWAMNFAPFTIKDETRRPFVPSVFRGERIDALTTPSGLTIACPVA